MTQKPIPPGGLFNYRFKVTAQMVGSHIYHTPPTSMTVSRGGVMTYIQLGPKEEAKGDYLAAGALYYDPTRRP